VALGAFKTTSWTVVLAAKDEQRTASREALQILCEVYWPPLYSYVRHKGYSVENAKDMTQEFFATLLAKNYLKDVNPAKGRFRSFLLASLNHFLANERAKGWTQKRGGRQFHQSLDILDAEQRYASGPSHSLSPEALFDAEWARTTLELALKQLEAEYTDSGKDQLFTGLRSCLTGARTELSYRDLATNLNMTEGAIKVAIHRLRKRYGTLLRNVIADTVEKSDEVEEELKYLAQVVGSS
jgi:RNA polymerase sigma-70 factor (ECF subfamily)